MKGRIIPPNKKTYQMDPANYREALRELQSDEAEGADIMMVKPGLPYLDVIRLLRDNSGGCIWQHLGLPCRASSASEIQRWKSCRNSCSGVRTRHPEICQIVTQLRQQFGVHAEKAHLQNHLLRVMLKAAAERGWLDERDSVLESLMSLKRAGADLILTYYATQAAKWLAGEK